MPNIGGAALVANRQGGRYGEEALDLVSLGIIPERRLFIRIGSLDGLPRKLVRGGGNATMNLVVHRCGTAISTKYFVTMSRIRIHPSTLIPCTYAECGICVEPSEEDVRQAVAKGDLESRGMDEHQAQIRDSLLAGSNNGSDVNAVVQIMKDYHTRRVAYFVVNGVPEGDPHPITINRQNCVTAGNHRVRAARYLKLDEIEVEVTG